MFRFLIVISVMLLTACAVYKLDVQQGTLVTQEMLDRLEYGMPSKTVRFIMGTPSIQDVFHQNRWDYVYTLQQARNNREQQHIVLFFENDRLTHVEGNVQIGKRKTPSKSKDEFKEDPIL